jgi:uncharacterized protein YdcH (DUF465 family)
VETAKFTELPKPASLPSFHRLCQEHSLYERRLDTLRAKPFPTEADQMEEVRLKKLKLMLKDEMERRRRLEASLSNS